MCAGVLRRCCAPTVAFTQDIFFPLRQFLEVTLLITCRMEEGCAGWPTVRGAGRDAGWHGGAYRGGVRHFRAFLPEPWILRR